MKNLLLKTSNEFNEAFLLFQSSHLADKLNEKFRIKPFFEQYQKLRNTVASASYLIHIFAVATSFIGVLTFLLPLVHNALIAAILASVFLLFIEVLKRLTIPSAIKHFLQFKKLSVFLILASLALTTLSIALSFTGAHDTVILLTPNATTIDTEPTRSEYKERIKTLENQKRSIKKSMSWKGVLTPQGAKAYNEITAQVGRIEGDMINNINRITSSNTAAIESHTSKTTTQSKYFAIFAVIFDLSLFFAFWFLEYYDYRSFAEFAKFEQNNGSYQNNTVATEKEEPTEPQPETVFQSVATENNNFSLNANTLDLAMKKAKANIAAYNAKISKGEGRPESNAQGLHKWTEELKTMEQMIIG